MQLGDMPLYHEPHYFTCYIFQKLNTEKSHVFPEASLGPLSLRTNSFVMS